jgi:hypothetical protein
MQMQKREGEKRSTALCLMTDDNLGDTCHLGTTCLCEEVNYLC